MSVAGVSKCAKRQHGMHAVHTAGQAQVLSHLPRLVFYGHRLHFLLNAILHGHINNGHAGNWKSKANLSAVDADRVSPWRSSVWGGGA